MTDSPELSAMTMYIFKITQSLGLVATSQIIQTLILFLILITLIRNQK